ncbi:alpha/beta hydrolase family protein [Crossiella equi]|nr:prolyl oligopeptidase family serine peptidase [Crossiella equi]
MVQEGGQGLQQHPLAVLPFQRGQRRDQGRVQHLLVADRPDHYSAAVSSAPGFAPYSSVLYECYLGFPQTDREAYRKAETYPLATNLEAAYLLACGTVDHATWTDSLKMSEALIQAGKAHEFVALPGQFHAFDSLHDGYFWEKVGTFFRAHLGSGQD